MRARRERGVGSPIGSILGLWLWGARGRQHPEGCERQGEAAHRSPNASQASASPSACQAWDETP